MFGLDRDNIKYLLRVILVWIGINASLNFAGFFVRAALDDEVYFLPGPSYLSIKLSDLAVQTLVFSCCLLSTFAITKTRRWSLYSFPLFQIVLLHLLFFINLEHDDDGYAFVTSWPSVDLTYLQSNYQSLVDVISVYSPMYGAFDCGMFSLADTFRFYIMWIFLPLIYFK